MKKILFITVLFVLIAGSLFATADQTATAVAATATFQAGQTLSQTPTPSNTQTVTPTVTQTFTQTPAITPLYTGNSQSLIGVAKKSTSGTLLFLGTYTVLSVQNLYSVATPGSSFTLSDAINPWTTPTQSFTFSSGTKGIIRTGTNSEEVSASGASVANGIVFKKGVIYKDSNNVQVESINGK
jgi:hypothetical protein